MKPLDRLRRRWWAAILLVTIGLGGFAQAPAVLARISVERATATWSATVAYPEAAASSAQKVAPRILLDNAAVSSGLYLVRPEHTRDVAPRVLLDYAAVSWSHPLERPLFASAPAPPPPREPTGKLRVALGEELAGIVVRSPRSVLLVVDASGSMDEVVDGQRKMDTAKAVLLDLVAAMPAELAVGLLVFKDCAAIDLVAPVGPLDRQQLGERIRAIQPVAGTPITKAIERVPSALAGHPQPYLVVLVTDGMETCGGNPVRAGQDLMSMGFDLRIHVVGYDVAGFEDVQRQLREIAAAGGGTYFNADTTEALRTALQVATPVAYRVYDAANALVASGTVGDEPRELRAGTFRVVISTVRGDLTVAVTVKDQTETTVWLDLKGGVFQTRVE